MKIAVFSDIHGNLEALDVILKDIDKGNYDEVICLGDIISIGPSSLECLDRIINSNIKVILGNHDLYFIKGVDKFDIEEEKVEHYKYIHSTIPKEYIDKIKKYPLYYYLEENGYSFKFCHFFIKNIKNIYPYYGIGTIKRMKVKELLNLVDTDYVIYGHDHDASHFVFGKKHLVDIGSSGCVKDDNTFYTVITIDDEVKIETKKIKFDRKKFEDKIRKANYPMLEHYAEGFYGIKDLH